jgi:predicted negative regulator of RcsB-dependent stress response
LGFLITALLLILGFLGLFGYAVYSISQILEKVNDYAEKYEENL